MDKIAKVIVDVPTMQTDRPFDYLIPSVWDDRIKPGMRVAVPFGAGKRQIQGFVVEVSDEADFTGELKEIVEVLDLEPVLSEELLSLSTQLAHDTFAFKISCLQAMLPSVMRAKYEKTIHVIDELEESLLFDVFKGREEMEWAEAVQRELLPLMANLKKQDKIDISYGVHNKAKVKTVRMVSLNLSFEQVEEEMITLAKRAPKQAAILRFLQQLETPMIESVLLQKETGSNSAMLKNLEKKQWIRFSEQEMYRNPFAHRSFEKVAPHVLTEEQEQVLEPIIEKVQQDAHQVFLLKGVTGSGKTEVYLQGIANCLQMGKQAMMLVPEIALTPQMVERFKGRFGDDVAVLHSGLSEGEKYDEWRKIERGEAKVVVGARSAIFAPFTNLGLIIIDEEHETTYKQDESPRYHARDVAIWRGKYHDCPVILGSATPSLESRARAQKKVYQLLELTERANKQMMPEVEVIDMRQELKQKNRSSFSMSLQRKIRERIEKGEQIVLLLNRRGYSSFVMCRDCGYVLECPNCDISQTLHMDTKTMKCHYCGHEEPIPHTCNSCGGHHIRYYGTGTQKIEEELRLIMPEARIIRMDVDTTRKKGAHERLLKAFEQKEADILLGTQMIAKGLDFPNITLVGVLNADTSLGLPDFRASEKTFQLLTQVSGRSGRGEALGEVIVQTFNPEHYAIQLAKNHDYDQFYLHEMQVRHRGNYPPYYFTIMITTSHAEELVAAKKISQMMEKLKNTLSESSIVLGPTPKSIARVNNRYYYQSIIKYKNEPKLMKALHKMMEESQKEAAKGLYVSIDPEPTHFM